MPNDLTELEFRTRHAIPQPAQRSAVAWWLLIFSAVLAATLAANLVQLVLLRASLEAAAGEVTKERLGAYRSPTPEAAIRDVFDKLNSDTQAQLERARPILLPRYGSPEATRQGRACISGTAMTRLANGWQQDLAGDRPIPCRDQ